MGWQEDLADLVGDVTGTGADWAAQVGQPVSTALKPPPYLTWGGSRLAQTLAARKPLQDLLLPSTDPAVTALPPVSGPTLEDVTDLLGRVKR